MQSDGNLVLYPANSGDSPADAYWSSGTPGSHFMLNLYLKYDGSLILINASNLETILNITEGLIFVQQNQPQQQEYHLSCNS
jgi:hypothetical protein